MNKIILYELNEVPIRILDYYRKMRPNSWFAKNYDNLKKFETYSENPGHLSPWNTWPTLHRGVASDKHFISDFNQNLTDVNKEFPAIWQILAEENVKVGVFGSLHSYPLPASPEKYKFYVPDVFAAGSECFPKDVEIFQDINLKLSRKSARNVDSSIPYKDIWKLMMKVRTLGFKSGTMMDVGGHLVAERMNRWKSVRRRTYQTVIGFDVFYKLLNKNKPDFVTFFTNHVASSQHRYWAAAFPDDYEKMLYDQEWINTYNNEILFTMDKTDEMLKRLSSFVAKNPDYKLMVTSSMGQDAVECQPIETQLYIVDHEKFMNALGVKSNEFEILPAMLPQFNYAVSDAVVDAFKEKINNTIINGTKLSYRESEAGRFSLDLGHQNCKGVRLEVNGKEIAEDESGLKNVEIEDKSSSTAYHIPEGHLFIYHPSFSKSEMNSTSVETCEILPTLMSNFGLNGKDYMKAPSKVLLA